jgi:hypothetical protein
MSRRLLIQLLWSVILILSFTLMCLPEAKAEWHLIELDEVSINYKNFMDGGRNPYFYDSVPKEEVNYQINTTVAKHFYWNTKLHSMTNDAQYYMAGLNLKLGFSLTDWLDVQYEHFSRHVLDHTYPHQKFGVEDSVGIVLFLYRKAPPTRPGIF